MRWIDVYDAQVDLVTGLSPGNLLARQVNAFLESVNRKEASMWGSENGPAMATRLAACAFNADPIYIEPEMHDVWLAAAESFHPEPLVPEDLITPAGFAYFPKPVFIEDIHGKQTSYRAVMWYPQDFLMHNAGKGPAADGRFRERQNIVPEGWDDKAATKFQATKVGDKDYQSSGLLVSLWHHTRDTDDWTVLGPDGLPPMLILSHLMPWTWGAQWDIAEDRRSIVRPVQALWRLMTQTITDIGEVQPDRQARKRWLRVGLPEKKVTVVRLRRPRRESDEDHVPTIVNWTHRWLVGGHWRNQWYPSLGIHRQKWISPYQKGPADKPLEVKKLRVFTLVR